MVIFDAFNPFIPKSDQVQISPAASPEILHHTVWRTWLFIDYSDERWLYTTNSHYLPYTFLFKKVHAVGSLRSWRSQPMRWTVFTGAILNWWQMGDWGLVTKLRCGGKGSRPWTLCTASTETASYAGSAVACNDASPLETPRNVWSEFLGRGSFVVRFLPFVHAFIYSSVSGRLYPIRSWSWRGSRASSVKWRSTLTR